MFLKLSVACALLFAALSSALAADEEVVTIMSRGQRIRALQIKPANPRGAVILLAGGHGNLDIGPVGKIKWGAGNQLVRTRQLYADAGFVTLVPDLAPDLKLGTGAKPGSRWSSEFASDVGAHVVHLRAILGANSKVALVGTSRAALTVAKAGATLKGDRAPDSLTITSGMIAIVRSDQPSVEKNVPEAKNIKQPLYVLHHQDDGCPYTPVSIVNKAPAIFSSSKLTTKVISGGSAGSGDPCDAQNHHGFLGQDQAVVDLVLTRQSRGY